MATPNVLIILSDQLRRDALRCHGDPNIQTPHIDQLAAGGVRFEAACSTYPVCVPYRFTLMTGHSAHSRLVPAILWRMSPAERTLADEFNEAGYESIYVGKWHLHGGLGPGLFNRPVPREYQGRWQKWFGFEFRNSFFDTAYFEDDDPTPHQIDGFQTDGLFDVAMRYLQKRPDQDRPFALCLSVEAPHPPFEAPAAYADRWRGRELVLPPNFMVTTEYDEDATDWSAKRAPAERDEMIENRRLYYAMVENLDDNVGRLLAFLEQQGLADNTIVVLTADHGECGGSHSLHEKQYAYEESVGVPLIVHGPAAGIDGGATINEPTCTEDLFPTLLGLAGLVPHPREPLHGRDLSPLVRGESTTLDRPGVMLEFVSELRPNVTFWKRVWRAWRTAAAKYVVFGSGATGGLQPYQFFDLQADPHELHNLIAAPEHQARIAEHHRWLRARMAETGDHEWLAAAYGEPALNAWVPCEMKAHKGEFEERKQDR
ncbi:sulfatase-like hydrolase/transferase [bacterium]|nr:sulfatase-like hydrolase/transferase [bacterium]